MSSENFPDYFSLQSVALETLERGSIDELFLCRRRSYERFHAE
jgi:hypothetical protein